MTIGITTLGADGGKSGISRYVAALLREFAARRDDLRFEIVAHEGERDYFAPEPLGLKVLPLPDRLREVRANLWWHQSELPRLARRRRWDAVFLPAGNRRLPWSVPCPSVGTVFDYSLRHVPGKYDAVHRLYITRALPALTRRLTRVLTLSECSKRDIVRYAGVPEDRIRVVPGAADARFQPRTAPRAGDPYLLYVSRIEHPGKNHVRLIEAFGLLKRAHRLPHRLVLAGSDWNGADVVHRAAAASPFARDIHFTGYVSDDAVLEWTAGAALAVFPSLWEGFGLPVLEAMQCAVPVACAGVSSLPEVAGEAAAPFDPTDPRDIADVLGALLTSPERCADLAARGRARARRYSWRRAADQTCETLRAAVAEGVR